MNKCFSPFAIACMVIFSFLNIVVASEIPPMTDNLEWKGRIVVHFDYDLGPIMVENQSGIALIGNPELDALARQYNVTSIQKLIPWAVEPTEKRDDDISRYYVLEFPTEIDLHEVAQAYLQKKGIVTAEPYMIRKVDYVPNDPFFGSQWAMSNVNAPAAYDYTLGDPSVIVGIVDSGTDTTHPDLRENLWVNPGEDLNGDGIIDFMEWNGIDDDGNGFIDDFWGWNVWQNNNNIQDPITAGHGTHCAGDVTARTDNGIGVSSLGCKARIMTARAGNGQYIYASASGMAYCANNGAKVLSLSYGGPSYVAYEQTIINNAWNAGVAIFASAGNENTTAPHYPSAYNNVVSVAAIDQNNNKASFSNYGPTIDICAPGQNILNTTPGGTYQAWDGTSFSCPIAAGLACMLWAANPAFTNATLIQHIYDHCIEVPGYPGQLGYGRIDAGASITSLFPNLAYTERIFDDQAGNGDGRPDPGETVNYLITLVNNSTTVIGYNVTVTLNCDDPDIMIINGQNTFSFIQPGASANNHASPLSFSVASNAQAHVVVFTLSLNEQSFLFPQVLQITQMIGRPAVIIMDDDGGSNYERWYAQDLDSLNVVYDTWSISSSGEISTTELMLYNTVIWLTSNQDSPLGVGDQSLIEYFVTHGGRLFLTGEDIDEQLAGSDFYADILKCSSGGMNGAPQLSGVAGDTISNNTSLFLVGAGGAGNSQSPAVIAPLSGSTLTYTYTSSGLGAGIYWGNANGKLVYFAFCFEAASGLTGSTPRKDVLQNILNWFGDYTAIEPKNHLMPPSSYALHQNYPNPFNPKTKISFTLPKPEPVRLAIYDLSGRLVETLLNTPLSAGVHQVEFDARDSYSSGIYLYKLETTNAMFTRKMVLLK